MKNLFDMITYLFLIAIPEFTFVTLMTLIIIKRFDFLDLKMWRHNLKWLTIPILSSAVTISVLTYYLKILSVVNSLLITVILIGSIYYVVCKNSFQKVKPFKTIVNICLGTFISGIIVVIGEFFVPILYFMLDVTKEIMLKSVFSFFLFTIPSRMLQIGIIIIFVINKNNSIQEKTLHILFKNTFLRICTIIMCAVIFFGTIYCAKLICVNKILSILTLNEQIFICILLLCIPVVCAVFLYVFINYIFQKEKSIQQSYEALIKKDNMSEV